MLLILIFISSGLFLGWLTGKNDTINLFGSSVSSKMIDFRKAALVAGFFIIIGAVFQGGGTTSNINELGNIKEPAISFLIALCAAIVILIMIRLKLPVSTSQAVVGGIVGWDLFSNGAINWSLIYKFIIAWILAPVIGIILGILFFILMRRFLKKSRIHLIRLDGYIKIALIVVIALSAFGLGANNIGNIIGIFSNFSPEINIDFGIFSINGLQLLLFLGGISITIGIFSSGRRYENENETGILSLAPESTVVVLAAQATVLFLFSSTGLSNLLDSIHLPSFPLVPISSTQIVIGAIIGIGIIKGAREIENRSIAAIGIGWILAPIGAGILSYILLYFLQKVFGLSLHANVSNIMHSTSGIQDIHEKSRYLNMVIPGIVFLSAIAILLLTYLFFRQQKMHLKMEKDMLIQQNQLFLSQRTMNELELRTIATENETLNVKLQAKKKEFIDIALNINEQRVFLEQISDAIDEIIKYDNHFERTEKLKELSLIIKQKMSFSKEKKEFYVKIEEIHKDFHLKLKSAFPNLTDLEKRLAGLLRLNLSNKEISSLLNISPKSVEVARYRLKKKMNLKKNETLNEYINNL